MTMTDTKTVTYTHHNLHNSKAIIESWYDSKTQELYVMFPSGQIAGYENVDENDYTDLVNAPSAGRYYSQFIKNRHRGINTRGIEFVEREATTKPDSVEIVDVPTGSFEETYFVVNLLIPIKATYAARTPQEAAELAEKDYAGSECTSVEWKP